MKRFRAGHSRQHGARRPRGAVRWISDAGPGTGSDERHPQCLPRQGVDCMLLSSEQGRVRSGHRSGIEGQ